MKLIKYPSQCSVLSIWFCFQYLSRFLELCAKEKGRSTQLCCNGIVCAIRYWMTGHLGIVRDLPHMPLGYYDTFYVPSCNPHQNIALLKLHWAAHVELAFYSFCNWLPYGRNSFMRQHYNAVRQDCSISKTILINNLVWKLTN